MKFIDTIRANLSKRKYRQIASNSGEVERDFLTLEAAKQVGVIVNLTRVSEEDFEQIVAFIEALNSQGKDLVIIELNFTKNSDPVLKGEFTRIFINTLYLDWLLFPEEAIEEQVKKLNLDVLLNLDQSINITSKYLCRIIPARSRIGVHEVGFEDCYELMVDPQSVASLGDLIKMFDGYLSMVRK